MKTLKPGELVVAAFVDDYKNNPEVQKHVGTVESVKGDIIAVRDCDDVVTYWHHWQVRRLVKKPRRRVWIPEYLLLGDALHQDTRLPARVCYPQNDATEQVEFVEVRKK